MEHTYLDSWKRYRRILSQRNATLKTGAAGSALRSWTTALLESGAAVDASRRSYVTLLAPLVAEFGKQLLEQPLSIEYRPGWSTEQTFEAALEAAGAGILRAARRKSGPTGRISTFSWLDAGCRMRRPVASRSWRPRPWCLAQLAAGSSQENPRVLLVDDPAAELDSRSLRRLLEVLERIPAQLVLTALSAEQLPPTPGYPVFHVERGSVRGV